MIHVEFGSDEKTGLARMRFLPTSSNAPDFRLDDDEKNERRSAAAGSDRVTHSLTHIQRRRPSVRPPRARERESE